MKAGNQHERISVAPQPIAGFGRVWPAQIVPASRPQGRCLRDAGLMLWEESDRLGAARCGRSGRAGYRRGAERAGPLPGRGADE